MTLVEEGFGWQGAECLLFSTTKSCSFVYALISALPLLKSLDWGASVSSSVTADLITVFGGALNEWLHGKTYRGTCVHALSLSCVRLFVTPWTVIRQAPVSMGFPRQECWSGLPCPPPGDLPDPGIKPKSPALQADSLPLSHLGNPQWCIAHRKFSVCLVIQSCPTFCNPMDCSPQGSYIHEYFSGKNTGVGCHAKIFNRWELYNLTFLLMTPFSV